MHLGRDEVKGFPVGGGKPLTRQPHYRINSVILILKGVLLRREVNITLQRIRLKCLYLEPGHINDIKQFL